MDPQKVPLTYEEKRVVDDFRVSLVRPVPKEWNLQVCVVWCSVVWCGVVWCGVVWCGVVWCGVVWCCVGGVVWCSVV